MKYCSKCGAENENSAKFCGGCGSSLNNDVSAMEDSPKIKAEQNAVKSFVSDHIEKSVENLQTIDKSSKKRRRYIIIGSVVAVAVCLAVGIPLANTYQAKQNAISGFKSAAADIQQNQNSIQTELKSDQGLLSQTKSSDLADSSLLNQLKDKVSSAENLKVSIPKMASDTDAINKQVADLQNQDSKLTSTLNQLQQIPNSISDSKQKHQLALQQQKLATAGTSSITVTDSDGNKEKITVAIGKWLKGSDSDLLNAAWKAVGGTGSMPLTGSYGGDSVWVGGTFHPQEAVYVFGTVKIENMTPSFSAANFASGQSWVYLNPQNYEGSGDVVQGRQYSSGASCDRVSGSNPLIKAQMNGNVWGPTPFVIGIENVFTPKYPNGDPTLDNIYFSLSGTPLTNTEGDTKLQITKSW
ncbi:MAG: zinc ribbon domain-containing protein [Sporolactobacillus sp.]